MDEEISAMLQANHANIRQASLNGVIASAGSAAASEHQISSFPYHLYPAGFGAGSRPARGNIPRGGVPDVRPPPPPPVQRGSPPQRRSAFNMEEKYILEAKTEILDATALQNGATYGAVYENSGPSIPMGLHRYHSAPASTFLSEMSEGGHHVMSSLYTEGVLTPITENMDMERMGSNNFNSGEYEHYMAPENDFCRRAAFPASLRKDEAMPGMSWDSKLGPEWFAMSVSKYCLMKFR